MHFELLQCSGGINSHYLFAYAYSDVLAQLMETISHQIAVVPFLKIHQPYVHMSVLQIVSPALFWVEVKHTCGQVFSPPCPQPSAACPLVVAALLFFCLLSQESSKALNSCSSCLSFLRAGQDCRGEPSCLAAFLLSLNVPEFKPMKLKFIIDSHQ